LPDNVQNLFAPVGTCDVLEIARWTPSAGHLGFFALGRAYTMIARASADIMGYGDYGLHERARAYFIFSEAEDIEDSVASGPPVRQLLVG
jgi:cytosine/adenosine deaminase-related metal-dependent hydrolase